MPVPLAVFSGTTLGDVLLSGPRAGSTRNIIEDEVSGVNAIRIANRGGGAESLELTCAKNCTSYLVRLTYLNGLRQSLGNALGTLTVTWGGSAATWTATALVDLEEDFASGTYLEFRARFRRSVW